MQEKNNKKSFWPYGIAISILLVAAACAYNVKIALALPVEYDTYFLSNKQNLDENINILLASQKEFNKKFHTKVVYGKFTEKDNSVKIKILNRNTQEVVNDAKFELLITRPDVSTYDIKPKYLGIKDGYYTFESFDVNQKGRWQILFTTTIGKYASFEKLETYAIIK